MINCWFKLVKAAKPVEGDVILADANVETKEDKHKPFSRLWVTSGPAATVLLTLLMVESPTWQSRWQHVLYLA